MATTRRRCCCGTRRAAVSCARRCRTSLGRFSNGCASARIGARAYAAWASATSAGSPRSCAERLAGAETSAACGRALRAPVCGLRRLLRRSTGRGGVVGAATFLMALLQALQGEAAFLAALRARPCMGRTTSAYSPRRPHRLPRLPRHPRAPCSPRRRMRVGGGGTGDAQPGSVLLLYVLLLLSWLVAPGAMLALCAHHGCIGAAGFLFASVRLPLPLKAHALLCSRCCGHSGGYRTVRTLCAPWAGSTCSGCSPSAACPPSPHRGPRPRLRPRAPLAHRRTRPALYEAGGLVLLLRLLFANSAGAPEGEGAAADPAAAYDAHDGGRQGDLGNGGDGGNGGARDGGGDHGGTGGEGSGGATTDEDAQEREARLCAVRVVSALTSDTRPMALRLRPVCARAAHTTLPHGLRGQGSGFPHLLRRRPHLGRRREALTTT